MEKKVAELIECKTDKVLDGISRLLASRYLANGDRAKVQVLRREFAKYVSIKNKGRFIQRSRIMRVLDGFKLNEDMNGEVRGTLEAIQLDCADLFSLYWFVDITDPEEGSIGMLKVNEILAREVA
ncbi:hypothetical protein [Bacillus mycoides]|uniref:hypothetical protein n=1 Tax=Bacillus mycoides TaxID=1405 RepID=UPI003A80571C